MLIDTPVAKTIEFGGDEAIKERSLGLATTIGGVVRAAYGWNRHARRPLHGVCRAVPRW
jgi:hypothetical protein